MISGKPRREDALNAPRTACLVLAAAALAACADAPPPPGPVFESVRASLRAEDYGAIYDLLAAPERRRIAKEAEQMRADLAKRDADPELAERLQGMAAALGTDLEGLAKLSDRELFARGTRAKPSAMLSRLAESEPLGEPLVEGETARQRVRLPGASGKIVEMRLVLEDGAWRLVLR